MDESLCLSLLLFLHVLFLPLNTALSSCLHATHKKALVGLAGQGRAGQVRAGQDEIG